MKIFTPEQMRAFDREAVEKYKIPSIVLMENAALRVVEFCEAKFAPIAGKRVLVACGKGNNGGDGFAIARHLSAAGCFVTVVLACKKSDLNGDALVNFEALTSPQSVKTTWDRWALPAPVKIIAPGSEWPSVHFVVDALLGTGFKGGLRRGPVKTALEKLQDIDGRLPTVPLVAVDVPSGLDAATGEGAHLGARADYTVTFAAPKSGFFVREGVNRCGEIWVGDIGTHKMQMCDVEVACRASTGLHMGRATASLERKRDAHKGDAGRVLIVGGSRGMSGAVALASRSALAAGTGLCLAMVPDAILDTVAASVLEATTKPLACDDSGALTEAAFDAIAAQWDRVQCVAVGPGLGRSEQTLNLVRRLVRECPATMILDADALYALRSIADEVRDRKAPTILTPHPGEMAELLGIETKAVQAARYDAAMKCAKQFHAVVVLKGAYSLVLGKYETHVNLSGNSGMATGGSGDVLTGTLAAVNAGTQRFFKYDSYPSSLRMAAEYAARIGVYAHGLAGDLAYVTRGNGLVAGDIAAHLPLALKRLETPTEPDEINPRLRRLH